MITYRVFLVRVHTHPEREKLATVILTEKHPSEGMKHRQRDKGIQTDAAPYGMLIKDSMGMVPPPQIQTVKKTIRRVVENII